MGYSQINPPRQFVLNVKSTLQKTSSQSRKSVYRAEGTAVPQPIYLQTSFHVHKIEGKIRLSTIHISQLESGGIHLLVVFLYLVASYNSFSTC